MGSGEGSPSELSLRGRLSDSRCSRSKGGDESLPSLELIVFERDNDGRERLGMEMFDIAMDGSRRRVEEGRELTISGIVGRELDQFARGRQLNEGAA